MTRVVIDPQDALLANFVAESRHAMHTNRVSGGWRPVKDAAESLRVHGIGALGEVAVAKLYNCYYNGAIGDFGAKDVGPFQVRATRRTNGDLRLQTGDKDNERYMLVIVGAGYCDVVGWCWGRDGKNPRYWVPDDLARGWTAAYCVPQDDFLMHPVI